MAKKKAAAKPLSKAEIIDALAEKTEMSKTDIGTLLDSLDDLIGEQLGKDGPGVFNLPGLIKISRSWKKATKDREGINQFTKEPTVFKGKPAHYVVKTKPLKGLTDKVDGIKKNID